MDKHLAKSGKTSCGKKLSHSNWANKYSEVNCKNCMKTERYKQYLAGKLNEKPTK